MKIVLCYSGGLDSTTLLYSLVNQGHHVRCLSVNYGQRHHKEIQAAIDITRKLGVQLEITDLTPVKHLLAGSSQTSLDVDVPEGHYTEESMKATVVPNRNMVLLSLATAWAISTKSDQVAYAAHVGDHTIYPDCREMFVELMRSTIWNCDWHSVALHTPFLKMTKAVIIGLGHQLKVPFEMTWSCYKGGNKHCGKCGTCVERKEAFELAIVPDPTVYEE